MGPSLVLSCLLLVLSCLVFVFCLLSFGFCLLSCVVLSLPLSLSLFLYLSLSLSCLVFWDVFDCLGKRLGSILVVLGIVWGVLGHLGVVLGGLEALLDASWGASCGSLGRRKLWGRLKIDFRTHLGSQKRAKTEPKTTQNRSKNRLEKRSRFRRVLRTSWGDLGPILAPSWVVLEVVEWGFA